MQEKTFALGRQVGHVSHLFRRCIDNLIATESRDFPDDALTGRNFWVLRYLEEHEGETVFQKDLESAFKIRRSTVSCMVELMEQKGLLRRESVDGDARLKRLILTDKSKEILAAVSKGVENLESEVRACFNPKEYDALMSLLKRLSDFLENRETQHMKGTESNPL